jgi:endonuclease YncB( thermonuclease family)
MMESLNHPKGHPVSWKVLYRPLATLAAIASIAGLALIQPTPAHAVDRDCGDFSTQADAQRFFLDQGGPSSDPHRLDGDNDGIACESNPCPCSFSTTPPPSPGAQAQNIAARITAVVDGDTIKVRTSSGSYTTVRLLGIDTPEMSPLRCGARAATKSMRGMSFVRLSDGRLSGRAVTLTTDPTQDRRDRYGRLLAYATTRAGAELGRTQLRRGWAKIYVFEQAFRRLTGYRNVQAAARSEGLGVWGVCGGNFDRLG